MIWVWITMYAVAMTWCLAKAHYEKKWGDELLRRVNNVMAPMSIDRGELTALHPDQDCAPRVLRTSRAREIAELNERLQARSVAFLRPVAVRWRAGPSVYGSVERL